ncbi:hypothetical protein NSK_002631 [Nannochloropsis salina CCMP1776]|uniref:Uncharacterized protein n=1 Tax=Nannochloropsis salina CCMP1776 TaxID=1027361 RepID=A0A4D9D255_9STRA|nr:hypothetical protein NSK_002631 [Nannochloropsis salina CCMP1776]|eukprot:TFJ85811.1 hypothetical protein NSK_002631 [Nannochloropsis salina CCMP1776]
MSPNGLALGLVLLSFQRSTSLPAVHWFAPFYSGGGYCSEAIGFLQALSLQNVTLHIEQLLRHAADARPPLEESVVICHSEPGAWHPSRYPTSRCPPRKALYRVGRTMFETDRLPSGWAERMGRDKMDESKAKGWGLGEGYGRRGHGFEKLRSCSHTVWVPTAFQKRVFVEGGVEAERIQVIGEPVDTDFFSPENPVLLSLPPSSGLPPSLPPSSFLFLSIFKFEERKGFDLLLRAYFEAFAPGEEDVALLLLTNAYHSSDDFETPVKAIAKEYFPEKKYPEELPPVHIMSGATALQLLALYQAADVFVLPSRGEGWGRPHVEAMAMAKPVIATNWSGPTEFMTPTNSYPLHIEGLEEVRNGPFKGHRWASPSLSHLISLLQYTFSHQEEGREKGREARRDMVRRFSPEVMGEEVRRHLERIEERFRMREGERREGAKDEL